MTAFRTLASFALPALSRRIPLKSYSLKTSNMFQHNTTLLVCHLLSISLILSPFLLFLLPTFFFANVQYRIVQQELPKLIKPSSNSVCNPTPLYTSTSFLFSCPRWLISSHLISSHLISSHLISSHLISSHLISSHLISSHLISNTIVAGTTQAGGLVQNQRSNPSPHQINGYVPRFLPSLPSTANLYMQDKQ